MLKRSLKASPTGLDRAKRAFQLKQWSQEYLAAQVGLSTRNSVWKFFAGRPIERHIFMDICFQLDLDWQEIADLPLENPQPASQSPSLPENLISEDLPIALRSRLQGQIEAQCNIVQPFLGISQPVKLDLVYTELEVLTSPSNQRWLEVADLKANLAESKLSSLSAPACQTISALDAVKNNPKLVILGKPGSGKTTLLQHIALQCVTGNLKPDCLPILISLRIFAASAHKFSLLDYISQTWKSFAISQEQVENLVNRGQILILLDGLEEIDRADSELILTQIQQFAEIYYQNSLVVTCRLGTQFYPLRGFSYVELADLNRQQVENSIKKWFVATARQSETEGLTKAAQFLELLQRPENLPILELTVTPILLSLLCSVFQERSTFPAKRSKLYQEALEIMLGRTNNSQAVRSEQIYDRLSLPEKIKLLSQIATGTFEEGNYFFEKSDVVQIIADYLPSITTSINTDPETLWLDSEEILLTIEGRYGLLVERAKGIYSFSHLTFQEYLTARKIVASPNPDLLEESLQKLATRVTENQWREVIFLTVGMLPSADFLLDRLKVEINALFKAEPYLQEFLRSIERKVSSTNLSYLPTAVRAFYFGLLYNRDLNLATSLDVKLA
jgi:predicted NACHT family NTPase